MLIPPKIRVEVPRVFAPLLKRARYIGAHGGRGSGKSHFFAEKLALRCYAQPTRAVCIREVQNSLKESVQQLLLDKIAKLGISPSFDPKKDEIRGANGSQIIFRGMQAYNAENIKSLEGYDVAWVEEAQSLSAVSLRMLRPTIRKDGSEIWFSWNPRFDSDPVDALLRGASRPRDAIVIEANWNANPWFPGVLAEEKDRDYLDDPEMAEHVWGGGYQIISEGSYYARLLFAAERDGRVGYFPHDPEKPVLTSWDIGVDDFTAIWFWQVHGSVATVIDYYEGQDSGAQEIVAAALPEMNPDATDRQKALARLDRRTPYRYGQHFLPHDIQMREWGAGGRARILSLKAAGLENIHKGVPTKPDDRIEAVRSLLPSVRFHRCPRVEHGMKRLRQYRKKWNETLGFVGPLHDDASHGADAFGEFAVNRSLAEAAAITRLRPKPTDIVFEATPDGTGYVTNMSIKELVDMRERLRASGRD